MRGPAFTIAELLIVIAIISVLLWMGIEGWRALVGQSSVEGASNQVSAYIGRAREDARGLRVPRGVIFFPTEDQGVMMATVIQDDPAGRPAQIEIVPESETQALRNGVGAAFISNTPPRYTLPGVLMFDGQGQLFVRDYSVRKDGKLGKLMRLTSDLSEGATHLGVTLFRRAEWEGQPLSQRDAWLDKKGRQLFVNRYSGTLLDGGR